MSRSLPIVLSQATPREPLNAVQDLRAELLELLEDFPRTRLVSYPEYHTCAVSGGPEARRQRYEEIAEPLTGPRVSGLRDLAREVGVWLLPGTVIERGDDGRMYNTALAISPEGEIAASYRKVFPWRPFEPFTPGSDFAVFDVPEVGRVGLAICYDLWFPEVARQLTWMGSEVIIYPTYTSTIDRQQELVLAQATAIQNQVFVVATNAAAPGGTGRSLVVDPEGLVRTQAPSECAAVLTDVLDLDAVDRVRTYGTCGLNRMWSQFLPEDVEIPLPVYNGSIRPAEWTPVTGTVKPGAAEGEER
jgi:predicted amidohydrolase